MLVSPPQIIVRREIELRSEDSAAFVELIVQLIAQQFDLNIALARYHLRHRCKMQFTRALLAGLKRRVHRDMLHMFFNINLAHRTENLSMTPGHK